MKNLEETLKEYDYSLDPMFIANMPASPRDSAKLLVYQKSRDTVSYDTFANIGKYLPKRSVLVFNDTKVFPARIAVKKKTGGRVEILYVGIKDSMILALANHQMKEGEKVFVNDKIFFEVISKVEKIYTLRPSFPLRSTQKIFQKHGETPIPPYIKNTKLTEKDLREKYQTVFAKKVGSIAAPTASLHFTKRLLAKLKKQGIDSEFVTLHVNLGTFAPLTKEAIETGKLHTEQYEISEKTANSLLKAKKEGRPIVAVGTTAVRTLEEWANDFPRSTNGKNGETRLFIRSGYKFKFIDGMITNFHVPKSSLLMLVSAFIGREKLFELYKQAKEHNFRFFSFGDGMFIFDLFNKK